MNNYTEGSVYELSLTYQNITDQLKEALTFILHQLFPLYIESSPFFEQGKGIFTSIKTNELTYKCEVSWIEDGKIGWLDISVPTYQFEEFHQAIYPYIEEENEWLINLNEQLYVIAQRIYELAPYKVAIIGEEVGGLLEEVPSSTPYQTICLIPKGKKLINLK